MPLGEILTHINRLIADDMQQQLFVTLFVASLDASGQQLSYSSAGHPGYLVKPDGRVVTLQTDNTPLGISPLETYPTASVSEFALVTYWHCLQMEFPRRLTTTRISLASNGCSMRSCQDVSFPHLRYWSPCSRSPNGSTAPRPSKTIAPR